MANRGNTRVVSAEIQRDGRYLLVQRQSHAVMPDLWEFPGGRVRDGETDAVALVRALRHRIGCDVTVVETLMEVTHAYEGYDLTLVVCRVDLDCEPRPAAVQQLAWVPPESFGDYPFPGADQKTVELLLSAESDD